MKNKKLFYNIIYYVVSPLIYMGAIYLISFISRLFGDNEDFGVIISSVYALIIFFLIMPLVTFTVMRFSLFKWYVDPFAAAEIPIVLYVIMLIRQIKQTENLKSAFAAVNDSLCDEAMWFLLVCAFLFGLLASFSCKRKEGGSFSCKLISKI